MQNRAKRGIENNAFSEQKTEEYGYSANALRFIARITLFFFLSALIGTSFLCMFHKSYAIGTYSGQVRWKETETDDLWKFYQSSLSLVNPDDPESDPNVMTYTGSTFDDNYYNLINSTNSWSQFRFFSRSLYQNDSYVIPGLRQTNVSGMATPYMVPQGICMAGNYILISAYSSSDKVWTSSVIYVLDRDTGKYLTTLALSTRCHVGALAYSTRTNRVYIADSSLKDERVPRTNKSDQPENPTGVYRIWQISMRDLRKYVNQNRDSVYVPLVKYLSCNTIPSFIFIYKNTLFVGSFNANSFYPRSYATAYSLKTGKVVTYKLYLSYFTQGAQIVKHKGRLYVITSSSYGRNNTSYLRIYRIHYNKYLGWFRNPVLVRSLRIPNMSEDLDSGGDHLLINFESGATKYQAQNVTQNQIDRVLNASIGSLIDGYQMQVPYANETQMMDNALPGDKSTKKDSPAAADAAGDHIVERALIPSERKNSALSRNPSGIGKEPMKENEMEENEKREKRGKRKTRL